MKTILTKAVILKRYKIGEADRLLLAFTKEVGKILIIAKSVRKLKSKLAGHIEPYKVINLHLTKGNSDYYRLIGAEDKGKEQKYSIETLRHLEILAETIDLTLGEEEPNQLTFDTFTTGLSQIEADPHNSHLIATETLVKLLENFGYKPELDLCSVCGREVTDEQVSWSSLSGGLICSSCNYSVRDSRILKSKKTIVLLRILQSNDFVASRIKTEKEHLSEAYKLLSDYLFTHLAKPLKSMQV